MSTHGAGETLGLLPCPCCGDDSPQVHEWYDGAAIYCQTCWLSTTRAGYPSLLIAANTWNRRAPAAAPPVDPVASAEMNEYMAKLHAEAPKRVLVPAAATGGEADPWPSWWDDLGEECGFSPLSTPGRDKFIQMVRWTIKDAEGQAEPGEGGEARAVSPHSSPQERERVAALDAAEMEALRGWAAYGADEDRWPPGMTISAAIIKAEADWRGRCERAEMKLELRDKILEKAEKERGAAVRAKVFTKADVERVARAIGLHRNGLEAPGSEASRWWAELDEESRQQYRRWGRRSAGNGISGCHRQARRQGRGERDGCGCGWDNMITLADFTAAQVAVLCNGCGPHGWKVHSWKWRLAQWLTPRLRKACNAHDLVYTIGGGEDERVAGDHAFREEIADTARTSGRLVHWLLEDEQPILFALVERLGRKNFHYSEDGKPRTLEQVRAVADERIGAAA